MQKTQNDPRTQCPRCLATTGCNGTTDCPDCLNCDDTKTTWCPANGCDQGYLLDNDGEFTIRCTTCKGKGEVRCPKC